jgi:hypothetical protein
VLQATESHSQAPKLKERGAVIQAVHTEHDATPNWPEALYGPASFEKSCEI